MVSGGMGSRHAEEVFVSVAMLAFFVSLNVVLFTMLVV